MRDRDSPPPTQKRRRLPGSCDACKKRKVRCDSGQMPANRCSNCANNGVKCTHLGLTANFRSAKGYAENLEIRLEKMEQLLKKLAPGIDLNFEDDVDSIVSSVTGASSGALPRNDDLIDPGTSLAVKCGNRDKASAVRVFGKSSALHLIQTALFHTQTNIKTAKERLRMNKRDQFWDLPQWQAQHLEPPAVAAPYVFPTNDLLLSVVELYFQNINPFFPLLHRGIFMKGLQDGLHLKDRGFGGVVLLVCALGARYSTDPRVLLNSDERISAGWMWFVQVSRMTSFHHAKITFTDSVLYELQICALSTFYKQMTITTGHGNWIDIGSGLRLAQDVGAHRRKPIEWPTSKNEMWTRAFFVLLSIDRTLGFFGGRPTSMLDEEYDVDYPLECDDEYWDSPDPFKQPPDKPSVMVYFTCYLKLMDILAYTMRTLYACKRPTIRSKQRPHLSVQETIIELDSALNEWLSSLPEYLKWDPQRVPDIFFLQSAMLHINYYQLQILIHKTFIPSPDAPSPSLSFTICTNAARSCARIAGLVNNVSSNAPMPLLPFPIFSATVILVLSSWSKFRSGGNYEVDMASIQTCLNVLNSMESITIVGGKLWDILSELKETCIGPSNSNMTRMPQPKEIQQRNGTEDSHFMQADTQNQWESTGQQANLEPETTDLWSMAPWNLDSDDWNAFLNSLAQEWNYTNDIQTEPSAIPGQALPFV